MSEQLKDYLEEPLEKLSAESAEDIRDSLQKLDSLLGQLCILSNTMNLQNLGTQDKNKSFISRSQKPIWKIWRVPCEDDAIFGDFVRLQSNFQYNITVQIVEMLRVTNGPYDLLLTANNVLQGCLLLHPASRNVFKKPANMNVILHFLKDHDRYPGDVIKSTIQTLVCILVRNVPNLRVFEELKGPEAICSIFNDTQEKAVKHKSLEFLMFYLIPETANNTTQGLFEHPVDENASSNFTSGPKMRQKTTAQKASILKPYLANVEELINQFNEIKPFGKMKNTNW